MEESRRRLVAPGGAVDIRSHTAVRITALRSRLAVTAKHRHDDGNVGSHPKRGLRPWGGAARGDAQHVGHAADALLALVSPEHDRDLQRCRDRWRAARDISRNARLRL